VASLSLSLTNDRREIARAATAIETFGRAHAISLDDISAVNLALDEILANIISHAYRDDAVHTIELQLTLHDRAIHVVVSDDGRPFNPLTWPPPDLDVPIDRRPVGGLGLYIARSVVDSIEYRREDEKNVLTLWKRCGPISSRA
jgi:anti-sigma regulatory factor (Ser/Thr protein kinase)